MCFIKSYYNISSVFCKLSTSIRIIKEEILTNIDKGTPLSYNSLRRGVFMSGSKKTIIILCSVIATLLVIISLVIGSFILKETAQNRENKKIAQNVIIHIEQLENMIITVDSENLIYTIKTEYDLLTDKQKSLVTNYSVLEESIKTLDNLKDKKVASELVEKIEKINKNTLTYDDKQVESLIDEYNALTDSQKALVTNYDKLDECKKIIDKMIMGRKLAENFEGFEGKWGDFGEHVNDYQAIVEEALHQYGEYTKYFSTPLNSLQFSVSNFYKDTTVFGIGVSYFTFSGTDKKTGEYAFLHGEIIIKEDGTLYCQENGYYY